MGVKLNIKTNFFYIIAYYYFIRVKPLIESITLLCEVGSRSKFKKILLPTFLFVENCLFLGAEVHHLVQFKKF